MPTQRASSEATCLADFALTDRQREVVRAYEEAGSYRGASRKLGISDGTFRVLNRRWRLVWRRKLKNADGHECWGLCESPETPRRAIYIDPTAKDEKLLDVLIHEMLHAADFRWDEALVKRLATDMASVLWRLGYRREGE